MIVLVFLAPVCKWRFTVSSIAVPMSIIRSGREPSRCRAKGSHVVGCSALAAKYEIKKASPSYGKEVRQSIEPLLNFTLRLCRWRCCQSLNLNVKYGLCSCRIWPLLMSFGPHPCRFLLERPLWMTTESAVGGKDGERRVMVTFRQHLHRHLPLAMLTVRPLLDNVLPATI